jgi:hypothetical protein
MPSEYGELRNLESLSIQNNILDRALPEEPGHHPAHSFPCGCTTPPDLVLREQEVVVAHILPTGVPLQTLPGVHNLGRERGE